MANNNDYINQKDYAKIKGVSPQYISQLCKDNGIGLLKRYGDEMKVVCGKKIIIIKQ